MIKVFCDYCEEEVKRPFFPYEVKFKQHFCNRKCLVAYRKSIGHYKQMSDLGKAQRTIALKQSNRDNPRRRRQEALWL